MLTVNKASKETLRLPSVSLGIDICYTTDDKTGYAHIEAKSYMIQRDQEGSQPKRHDVILHVIRHNSVCFLAVEICGKWFKAAEINNNADVTSVLQGMMTAIVNGNMFRNIRQFSEVYGMGNVHQLQIDYDASVASSEVLSYVRSITLDPIDDNTNNMFHTAMVYETMQPQSLGCSLLEALQSIDKRITYNFVHTT